MLKIKNFMGYLGFIRSHPTGEALMFQKILKIECLRGPQQMATDFFRLMQSDVCCAKKVQQNIPLPLRGQHWLFTSFPIIPI